MQNCTLIETKDPISSKVFWILLDENNKIIKSFDNQSYLKDYCRFKNINVSYTLVK